MLPATSECEQLGVTLGLYVITMNMSVYQATDSLEYNVTPPVRSTLRKAMSNEKDAKKTTIKNSKNKTKDKNLLNMIIKMFLISYFTFIDDSLMYAAIIDFISTQ